MTTQLVVFEQLANMEAFESEEWIPWPAANNVEQLTY